MDGGFGGYDGPAGFISKSTSSMVDPFMHPMGPTDLVGPKSSLF